MKKIGLLAILLVGLGLFSGSAFADSVYECNPGQLRGDANGDGNITVADSNIIMDIFMSGIEPANPCCFDINMDGNVSNLDALMAQAVDLNQYAVPDEHKFCGTVPPLPSPENDYSCVAGAKRGDVDGDGLITETDAQIIQDAFVFETVPVNSCCYDVDADGNVSNLDALYAEKIALGLEQENGYCGDDFNSQSDDSESESEAEFEAYSCSLDLDIGEKDMDINDDGAVDQNDAEIYLQIDAGLINVIGLKNDISGEIVDFNRLGCFDLNDDNKLGSVDAAIVLQSIETAALAEEPVEDKANDFNCGAYEDGSQRLRGDANGDGFINMADADLIMSAFMENPNLSGLCCFDANNDGFVSNLDALVVEAVDLNQYVIGDEDKFCGTAPPVLHSQVEEFVQEPVEEINSENEVMEMTASREELGENSKSEIADDSKENEKMNDIVSNEAEIPVSEKENETASLKQVPVEEKSFFNSVMDAFLSLIYRG